MGVLISFIYHLSCHCLHSQHVFTCAHIHKLSFSFKGNFLPPRLPPSLTFLGSENEGVLWGFTAAVFSPTLVYTHFGVSVCVWHDLYVHCTLFFFVGMSVRPHVSACACMFYVCVHYGLCLCYSQQGVQVDTVTVPRRATEGPCHPTTEALSLCSSWLVMDFLLSLSRFLSLF